MLFSNVTHQISRSQDIKSPILTRIERFRTVSTFWIHWWICNYAQSLMLYRRGALLSFVIHQISRSHGLKNSHFKSSLSKITRPVAAIISLRFALLLLLWYTRLQINKNRKVLLHVKCQRLRLTLHKRVTFRHTLRTCTVCGFKPRLYVTADKHNSDASKCQNRMLAVNWTRS